MLSIMEITDRLAPLFQDERIRLVILFGSVASGRQHPRSDIDLAFLFEEDVDLVDLNCKVTEHLKSDKVDIIDLRHANPLLKFSVARSGKLLYQKSPGLFTEFCSLAFRMYADSKKLRDAQAIAINKYLAAKGIR